MKIIKYIILFVIGALFVLSLFMLLGLFASSHKIPKSTQITFSIIPFVLITLFILIDFGFNHRENKIKSKLNELVTLIPNFKNSQENEWFIEYFQNNKWALALESIEYFISENEINAGSKVEQLIAELKKMYFLK